jgi:hypothetical protein
MAKDSPTSKPKTETPFQRFERLTRKIVRVPKAKPSRNYETTSRKSPKKPPVSKK